MASSQNPPLGEGGDQSVEVKSTVKVSSDQLAAYKSLPAELQSKLGPPVQGKVMTADALKQLAGGGTSSMRADVPSTVMCPW